MLASGGLVVIFPEGTPGIGKGFRRRYQLQPFRPGHAELAIRHRATIVPTGVVGAEESWPQLARLDRVRLFGAPYLPVPATPIPLPVRIHLWYGEPVDTAARYAPDDADRPDVVAALAREIQDRVAERIAHGRATRAGWFW